MTGQKPVTGKPRGNRTFAWIIGIVLAVLAFNACFGSHPDTSSSTTSTPEATPQVAATPAAPEPATSSTTPAATATDTNSTDTSSDSSPADTSSRDSSAPVDSSDSADSSSSADTSGFSVADGDVSYKVESTCPTDVTYTDNGGGTEQESDIEDGWSKDVTPGDFAYISAQLKCEGGDVTVSILQGGRTVKTANSSGDYSIAQVSYP